MYKTPKSLFIFDVDGTLVNAYQAIAQSLNFTRLKLGQRAVSVSKVKRSVGNGDKVFINTFFLKKDAKKALEIYRVHHKKALLISSTLMPNAKEVLRALRRRKKIIAVASNRPKYFTDSLLSSLKIKKYFNGVYCADQLKALKPRPKILNTILTRFKIKREHAVYIGDMDIDLETAKRAGIDAVFTKGGSSTLAQVRKYRAKKVVSDLKEILELYN